MAGPDVAGIIRMGFELGATDVHIIAEKPPVYRINGRLFSRPEDEALNQQSTRMFAEGMIPNSMIRQQMEEYGQADFARSFQEIGRVRTNLYIQAGSWAAALRLIPATIPQLKELGLPLVVHELLRNEKGLILVTGATGSGKTTTLAGMIDQINHGHQRHIITLEDPIEYIHQHGTCIVNQREVGSDTRSFTLGLRAALRQDPDIIMVGEIRDLETIAIAMTAAETGHLVLASLHSGSAVQTLERVIDVFPPHQQDQIRLQLATCLLGIICQQLIPSRDGKRLVMAAEVLIMNSAIRNLIRENKIHQIYSAIQTGASLGMVSMDTAIKMLGQQKKISSQEVNKRMGS